MLGSVYAHDPHALRASALPVLLTPRITPVIGRHLFLCVRQSGGVYAWAPLFSRPATLDGEHVGVARVLLERDRRIGWWRCFERDSFVDLRQWWIAPAEAFAFVEARHQGDYPIEHLTRGTVAAAELALDLFFDAVDEHVTG